MRRKLSQSIRPIILAMVVIVATVTNVFAQETILQTLERLRSKYPNSDATAAFYLNEVAWLHRGEGIVLLGKPSGHNCVAPGGPLVSCDYLVNKNTKRGWDVIKGDDAGTPMAPDGEGEDFTEALANGSRTLVAPVNPGSGPVDPPPVTPPPAVDLGPLTKRIEVLEAAVSRLNNALGQTNLKVDTLDNNFGARLGAVEDGLIRLQARPIPVSCTARIAGIPISCKLQ